MEYPTREEEIGIVNETTAKDFPPVKAVFSREDVTKYQDLVRRMPVSQHVVEYAVDLAKATRPKEAGVDNYVKQYVEWGAGPRASQYLILGAKSVALLQGKPAPSSEDVRSVALPVLQHRVLPNYNATGEGIDSAQIIKHLLKHVKERDYRGN